MADVSFTQTFHHTDWVDDVDRVRAAEPNGFNARFNAIEADLQQLSAVVAEVDAVLSAGPTGTKQRRLTLPPVLAKVAGLTPWVIGSGGAASVTPGSGATGVLNLSLPNNVTLTTFRAIGEASGAAVTVALSRVALGSATPQQLVSVTGDTDPFDRSVQLDPDVARTTTATTRYFVKATVPTTPATAVVRLAAVQITYVVD
jgi:hypothetical protein